MIEISSVVLKRPRLAEETVRSTGNEMKYLASESNDGNDYGFPEFSDNSRNLGKSWHAR